jgi:hypothetical protein
MHIDAYTTIGLEREYDLSAESLIRCLYKAHVDRAIIAPVESKIAVYNRQGNDEMFRAAREHPDRLIATCTVILGSGLIRKRNSAEALAKVHGC